MKTRNKPIPTEYNGYHFRSRLEARWAVFFDAMEIKYEYEMEGFDLDGIWYLPDFWFPQVEMWAEVKRGKFSKEEQRKCQLLANVTDKRCLLLEGPPDTRSYWGLAPEKEGDLYLWDTDYILSSEYLFTENRFYSDTGHSREEPATDKEFIFWDDYIAAVEKAKFAFRFRVTPGKYPM